MPSAAPRPCTYPGCGVLVRDGTSRCSKHKHIEQRQADQQRGTSSQRGYGSRWQKARAGYLRNHPLCADCEQRGRVTIATVVDHVIPHKGDMVKFWDSANNWQSLCAECHNSHKQRMEKSGKVVGCDIDGFPDDPNHHWR